MERKKLLIVEDDPVQIQILTTRLKASGYDIVIARDAVQCIGLIRKEKPQLVLLDIGLPGGDGYVVLQRLKSITHSAPIPVIAVSSREASTDRAKMLAAGADDYFQKPVDFETLLGRIRDLLGEASVSPQ